MSKDEIIDKIKYIAEYGEEFNDIVLKAERIKAIAAGAVTCFLNPREEYDGVSENLLALSVVAVIKSMAEDIENDISDGVQLLINTADRRGSNAPAKS